jgi:signal transduction histidine kinase/Tfp pilus assembly protein PilF
MKLGSRLVLLLFILTATNSYSQLQQADSLLELINSTKLVSEKADYLNTLGNLYRYKNQDSAFKYISKALEIAEQQKLYTQQAEAYNELGIIWYNKKVKDSSYYYLEKGYNTARESNDYRGMVKSLNSIGMYKTKSKDYEEASSALSEALSFTGLIKDQVLLSMLYNNVAILNKSQGNVDVALEYYHKALEIGEEQANLKSTGLISSNIGLLYEAQDKTELALKYLNQSLAIRLKQGNKVGESYVRTNLGLVYENLKEYGKALDQYRKSISIKKAINSELGMAILYNNMGIIFKEQAQYDSAFIYSHKSLELRVKLRDEIGEARTRITLGQIYLLQGNPRQAKKELEQAVELTKDYRKFRVLENLNSTLYQVSVSLNEYKNATTYLLKRNAYKDSIFNIEKEKSIAGIEAKYNSLKKEKENLMLKQENDLKDAKIKRQIIIVVVLVIVMLLILTLLVMIYRSRQQLSEKNNKIEQQTNKLTETVKEVKRLSEFKESMTNMLVHDLKTPLNIIVNYKDLKKLDCFEELLQQSGYTMLNLVHNILDVHKYRDTNLEVNKEQISLLEVLDNAFEEVAFLVDASELQISIKTECDYLINADGELLKRVFTNLFSNAIKYTPRKETITIGCKQSTNGDLRIEIANPGPGIPKEQQEIIFEYFKQGDKTHDDNVHTYGLGLSFCKLAIEAHQGKIGVISESLQGVVFWFNLPEAKQEISINPEFPIKWDNLKISKLAKNL